MADTEQSTPTPVTVGTMTVPDFLAYISPEGRAQFLSWLAVQVGADADRLALVQRVLRARLWDDDPDTLRLDCVDEGATVAMGAQVIVQLDVSMKGCPAEVASFLDGTHQLLQ